jgi:hypothetical protein
MVDQEVALLGAGSAQKCEVLLASFKQLSPQNYSL